VLASQETPEFNGLPTGEKVSTASSACSIPLSCSPEQRRLCWQAAEALRVDCMCWLGTAPLWAAGRA
jgi:hypothetical protein